MLQHDAALVTIAPMSYSSDWTFVGTSKDVKKSAKNMASQGHFQVRFDNETCVFILPKNQLTAIVRRLDSSALDAVAGVEPIEEADYQLAIHIDAEESQLWFYSNDCHSRMAWEVGCLLIRLLAEALDGEPVDDCSDELFDMLLTVPKVMKPSSLN